ncbi:MAG: DNA polymerase I [Acholeplasmataceae bacterium]
MKKLVLIDGNSLLFRAYYATAYPGADLMKTADGVYTNALFSFVNMFEKIEMEDAHVLVAFDTKLPTKRHEAYEAYKAGRLKMPEELAVQIPLIHEYLDLLGVPTYSKPGYEADDIIGTMAKRGQEEGFAVEVYSSDRDLLQLVDRKIRVNLLKKGMKEIHHYDQKALYERYELTPEQFIDLKALAGDPSDNIPGVPGVGEKTALKLLRDYGTLDNILAHKDEIKGKLGQRIRDSVDLVLLSKRLVTIELDAELDLSLDDLAQKDLDNKDLIAFFQKNELHGFVKRMGKLEPKEAFTFTIIDEEGELERILGPGLALHFEFSDPNYHKADLWGVGLSDGKRNYFLSPELALSSIHFQLYLSDPDTAKSVYNDKATRVFLKWQGIALAGVDFDLLLAAYLLNSHLGKEEFKRVVSHFDYDDIEYDELIYGKGKKKKLPERKIYAEHIASKAKAVHDLRLLLIDKLKEKEQYDLFESIEMPLSRALSDMEYTGITIDPDELDRQGKNLLERIEAIKKEIFDLIGKEFNIGSPKKLGQILFEDLGLRTGKKTKTGYSTNVDVLKGLIDEHPVIEKILDYRQLAKLYSTYIEGIRQNAFTDHTVHTIYLQALTTTGRLSSIEPNLQNIPIRTEEGRNIRKFFKARPGHVLLGSDYSQIELRVLADMANVRKLIEAFNAGADIHTETAKNVFHVTDVTSEQRRAAKAVNFGIIYGISAWSLSEDIGVSQSEAKEFIDRYLDLYPEIRDYMEKTKAFAKENGYVTTLMNRRRYIPELASKVHQQRAFGERTALNAPIQGSAADILKKAMIDIHAYLKDNDKKTRMLLQVHDEIILEVPEEERAEMERVIPRMMEEAYPLSVDLVASCDVGLSWYDLK